MPKAITDLTGCRVKRIKWTARGAQFLLSGKTSDGESVDGMQLTFENVVNLSELQDFTRNQRFVERKTRRGTVLNRKTKKFAERTVVVTMESAKPYPMKLPATLLQLRISKSAQASYGDVAFTRAHGKPPKANANQSIILFALDEKRFRNRRSPFPIICDRVTLKDKRGDVMIGTEEKPSATRWSESEYEQFGLSFFEALATSDLAAAERLLSAKYRKPMSRSKIAKLVGDFLGVADRLFRLQPQKTKGKAIDWFRGTMQVHVELDERVLWEIAQSALTISPPEAVRASLELCTECLRESLHILVVEESGEMRIEL